MKRLIKFSPAYKDDGVRFSDCSTKYEILPVLVKDEDGGERLQTLALEHGFVSTGAPIHATVEETRKTHYATKELFITDAIQVGETYKYSGWGPNQEKETIPVYLGFITLPRDTETLPLREAIGGEVTLEQATAICGNQLYGVSDVGETVDGPIVVVKSGWNYYHCIPLLGYSLESFQAVLDITEEGFDDDTQQCMACHKFDSRDNGYTYNFREHDEEWLGVNCGCYDEACKNNYEPFIDNPDTAMTLTNATALETEGTIEFIERFIGGMVDGRGGRYDGESVREGTPKDVFKTLKTEHPDKRYLFSIDESGQFQTYFSVWELTD